MFHKLNKDLTKTIKKCRFYSTNASNKYKATVLLPRTKFPQKLTGNKILEQNKFIFEKCGFGELYEQQKNTNKNEFILHDGPPYANGVPHLGHAINKIIKDVICRRKLIEGRKIHFQPGWDCHGLPIELKALKLNKIKQNDDKTPLNIRKIARNFATDTIKKQGDAFKTWGVAADWRNPYLTYSVPYIENQLYKFYELYEKQLIYRAVKPVYWSPSSRTALAEAELEYNEKHKSTSIIVRLKLTEIPHKIREYLPKENSQIYALIWTTTPWTLPSNQAICYNPNLSYSFVKTDQNIYLIASELVESVAKLVDKNLEVIYSFSGNNLLGLKYEHPINKNEQLPFLSGEHATANKGTGLVHTAPAHGPDDFLLALNHKIPVKSLVDERGHYSAECPLFSDLNVLTDANTAIINHLQKDGDILNISEIIHSYPYDWRTKKPVIIRASEQWFIDTNAIKNRAIELLQDVKIYPEKNSQIYKNNLISQLKKRPFWCISRQRVWGVPIPAFYRNGAPIINENSIEHLVKLLREHGPDFWWTLPVDKLFYGSNKHPKEIEKGNDILDIWFDSGISWSSALGDNKIADFYVEGVDQFTGWFQSSLITSTALRDAAPYKNLYVHGFVVDGDGRKMSKSLGNVVDPQDVIKPLGVDTLRWWVICHASQNQTEILSQNVLKSSSDEVQKLRNTLRFALSNLSPGKITVNYEKMRIVDRYMLHLLYNFEKEISEMYRNYEFNKICQSLIHFLTNQVSAFYFSIIKDRLYCDASENISRKDAQFTLEMILNTISKICAPIVPHLIEELFYYDCRENKPSATFFQNADFDFLKSEFDAPEISEIMSQIFEIKKEINKITNIAEQEILLKVSEIICQKLELFQKDELIEVLQIADVSIELDETLDNFEIITEKTRNNICLRCKRYNSTNSEELCQRCFTIVQNV